jgi:hypothetical protein
MASISLRRELSPGELFVYYTDCKMCERPRNDTRVIFVRWEQRDILAVVKDNRRDQEYLLSFGDRHAGALVTLSGEVNICSAKEMEDTQKCSCP